MRKLLFVLAVMFAGTIQAQEVIDLTKQLKCSDAQIVMNYFADKHKELPVWVGKTVHNTHIALLANKEFEKRKAIAHSTEFIGTPKSETEALKFVEVYQCGTGIMLISRECVRLMIEKCPEIVDTKKFKKMPFGNKFEQFITPFNKIELEDRELSEDYSFCYRWTQLCGGKILASTSRQIQHVGQYVSQTQFSDRW